MARDPIEKAMIDFHDGNLNGSRNALDTTNTSNEVFFFFVLGIVTKGPAA